MADRHAVVGRHAAKRNCLGNLDAIPWLILTLCPTSSKKTTAEESKELEAEQPGSLVLANPKYDHPRHLKARESTCPIAAQNALHTYYSLTSCVSPSSRYVCMSVCMRVDETERLAGKSDATSWT